MNARTPNWKKWKLIPNAKIWEIVALSLDIEPTKVKIKSLSWMAGSHAGKPIFEESPEFLNRIEIITANAGASTLLKPFTDTLEISSSCELNISDVGVWANSIGWELPLDFPAQSQKRAPQQDDPLNQNKSDLLATLNQASLIFWSKVNAKDKSSHPKNDDVTYWLIERGFSKTLADKGATIIRPKWAAIGRKPNE